jgi:hypothetical protein
VRGTNNEKFTKIKPRTYNRRAFVVRNWRKQTSRGIPRTHRKLADELVDAGASLDQVRRCAHSLQGSDSTVLPGTLKGPWLGKYVGFKSYTFLFRGEKIMHTLSPLSEDELN